MEDHDTRGPNARERASEKEREGQKREQKQRAKRETSSKKTHLSGTKVLVLFGESDIFGFILKRDIYLVVPRNLKKNGYKTMMIRVKEREKKKTR